MTSKIFPIETQEALYTEVEDAIQVLRNGGVAAIPTDTVYGLAAASSDESAIRRIYQIKGRPAHLAIPLMLNKPEDVWEYASDVPDVFWALAESFWPGPLTMVFRKHRSVSNLLTGGKQTVGLRVPDHRVPRSIVRELGRAITGTSANRSGRPSATSVAEVADQLGDEVDMVVDGGRTTGRIGSTVVDLSGPSVRILREGFIARQDIERALSVGLRTT